MTVAYSKAVKFILSVVALSQFAACAVMSKKECLSADWYRIGYTVGTDGKRDLNEPLEKRQKICAKHEVQIDRKQFMAGHQSGIQYFCDPYNAVQYGIDGRAKVIKNQVCPEDDYPGFSENFRAGFKLYELNQNLYRSDSNVANLQNRRSNYYHRLREVEERIRHVDTTDAQRRAYRQQYNSIQYRIREISYELRQVENELHQLRKRSEQYQDYLESEFLDPLLAPASGLPSATN